jgi:hypothetical protein
VWADKNASEASPVLTCREIATFSKETPMKSLVLGWVVMLVVIVAATAADKEKEDGAKIDAIGTLKTGVFAAGGETTGTILTTKDTTYELDFTSKEIRENATTLDGKRVRVSGKLIVKRGIEVGERRIINVTKLEEAKQ